MNKLLLVVLVFCLPFTASANEKEVSELLLSEIMFYRMQDNNFDAIAHYLNAHDNKEIVLNKNNHAYIASVYLNYDLHSQVKSMLDLLINNQSPSIRDMSWFYLGKLHYKNKRIKSAVKTFSKIKGRLTTEEQEIKHIMYGVMAMHDKKYKTAIKEFKKIPSESSFKPYIEFNLAIANMKMSGDYVALTKSLSELAESQNDDLLEAVVFADQIYTTLAYVLLQNSQFERAQEYFRKVTLDGHLATRALQGMIYSASELKQYEKALNLSLQLIKMKIGNDAIHHAYIVIPYILQQLNNTEKATAFYQHAVGYFSEQRIELKRYITKTKKGDFDKYLLDIEKILNVDQWVKDEEMSRLFRFVSTLDEWRDAVYKYQEMKYLQKRLDESFYELVVIEANVQSRNKSRYKKALKDIEDNKKKVEKSIIWHQKYARHFVIKALRDQYNDVTDYLSQARFALAQFYDREEQKEQEIEIEGLRKIEQEKFRQALKPVRKKQK